MAEERRRIVGVEWRAGDLQGPGILEGVAMRFGEVATLPWGRERFAVGSLSADSGGVILNAQHDRARPLARYPDGGLELRFADDALRIRARVADTSAGRDTVALVRAGVLQGLSVEFRAEDERLDDGVRVVKRALLTGVGVVDDGAYDSTTIAAMRGRQAEHDAARRLARQPFDIGMGWW